VFNFGSKWVVVSENGNKLVLTNNRRILACIVEDGKIKYSKQAGRFPKAALRAAEEYLKKRSSKSN